MASVFPPNTAIEAGTKVAVLDLEPVVKDKKSNRSSADQFCMNEYSSRIFIAMLHLYGTRGDTKIWAKIISAHAKKCSRMKVSVAKGRWVGQKKKWAL